MKKAIGILQIVSGAALLAAGVLTIVGVVRAGSRGVLALHGRALHGGGIHSGQL